MTDLEKIISREEYQELITKPEYVINIRQIPEGFFCAGKYLAEKAFYHKNEISYSTITVNPEEYIKCDIYDEIDNLYKLKEN